MDKALNFETTGEEAVEMQAEIARMIAEMKQLRTQRRRGHAEIERSQIETRAMLDTITEVLTELKAT